MKRTAFFISDGTGLTAEALGRSLLSQFGGIDFEQVTIPYVNSREQARAVVLQINNSARDSGARPIVFDTIVDRAIRATVAECEGFMVDIFDTFISPLEHELKTPSSYSVGKSHAIQDRESYKIRIDAIHYTLDNDDGARTRNYDKADIILTGVSRCGKTPTSLYLALQFGIRAANYPLTDEDIDDIKLPAILKMHKDKLFGLTINSTKLAAIRQERLSKSRYASLTQCKAEIHGVEAIFNKENVPYIDTSDISIEEISTRVLALAGLKRRLQG